MEGRHRRVTTELHLPGPPRPADPLNNTRRLMSFSGPRGLPGRVLSRRRRGYSGKHGSSEGVGGLKTNEAYHSKADALLIKKMYFFFLKIYLRPFLEMFVL